MSVVGSAAVAASVPHVPATLENMLLLIAAFAWFCGRAAD